MALRDWSPYSLPGQEEIVDSFRGDDNRVIAEEVRLRRLNFETAGRWV
jgi:hypothetical protein